MKGTYELASLINNEPGCLRQKLHAYVDGDEHVSNCLGYEAELCHACEADLAQAVEANSLDTAVADQHLYDDRLSRDDDWQPTSIGALSHSDRVHAE